MLQSMASSLPTHPRYSPRFVLRPFSKRDIASLDEAVGSSLPELAKWLPWAAEGYTRAVSAQFIRDSVLAWSEGKAFDFSIKDRMDPDRHIGNISLWHTSRPNLIGEIGYWVRTDETGGGICTEVAVRVLEVAFEELGMHRVTLRIAVGNRGSERVAEKLGFALEGTLRHEVRVAGHWLDHTIWGLLDTDWLRERERYRSSAWV
jgi:ribosomal-protein-serine acetyltransferase